MRSEDDRILKFDTMLWSGDVGFTLQACSVRESLTAASKYGVDEELCSFHVGWLGWGLRGPELQCARCCWPCQHWLGHCQVL